MLPIAEETALHLSNHACLEANQSSRAGKHHHLKALWDSQQAHLTAQYNIHTHTPSPKDLCNTNRFIWQVSTAPHTHITSPRSYMQSYIYRPKPCMSIYAKVSDTRTVEFFVLHCAYHTKVAFPLVWMFYFTLNSLRTETILKILRVGTERNHQNSRGALGLGVE